MPDDLEPTGCVLLIPCTFREMVLTPTDNGAATTWESGGLSFVKTQEVRDQAGDHLDERLDDEARRGALSQLGGQLLFPEAGHATALPSPNRRFRHRPPNGIELADGALRAEGFELLVEGDRRELVNDRCEAGRPAHHAVLLVHVSLHQTREALAKSLTMHVRARRRRGQPDPDRSGAAQLADREALVESLHLGGVTLENWHQGVLDFHVMQDQTESRVLVYPLLTLLDLDSRDDKDLILAREIATTTTSASHGSLVPGRLLRAQEGRLVLSDAIEGQVMNRGTVLMRRGDHAFVPQKLYSSAIYADLVAAVLLSELHLAALARLLATQTLHIASGQFEIQRLRAALQAQQDLLALNAGLDRLRFTESRMQQRFLERVRHQRGIEAKLVPAQQDIGALLELVGIGHQLSVEQHQEFETERSRRLDVIVGLVALVGVPAAIAASIVEMSSAGMISPFLLWFLALFATTAATLLVARFWRRPSGDGTG